MKKFTASRWAKAIAVLLAIYAIYFFLRAYDKRADGFTLEKITSDLSYEKKWDVACSDEKIDQVKEILNQPYRYLGRGFQCYAFVSEDQKYVLKFFRHQRLRPSPFYQFLSMIPLFEDRYQDKVLQGKKRLDYLMKSFKIAYEDVPEETGLLFIHLNKGNRLQMDVTIYDKSGNRFVIPIDQYEFVVQSKAELVKPTIDALMKQGKIDEAKRRINQIFELLRDCARKGIQDTDGALIYKNNLGFLPDRAIYIDSGKLARKPSIRDPKNFIRDLKRLNPLYRWLKANYPILADYFLEQKKAVIQGYLQ